MSVLSLQPSSEPIHRVAADVAVVTLFADERPLRGAAGLADWRLCGALSQLIRARRFAGADGEAALVPSRGGLRAPLVLAVGLGHRARFDAALRAERLRDALARGLALRVGTLAVALPPAVPGDDGLQDRVEALLAAASRALRIPGGLPGVGRLVVVTGAELRPRLFDTLRRRAGSVLPEGVAIEMPAQETLPRRLAEVGRGRSTTQPRVK